MIEVAARQARERRSRATFLASDLRTHHEPPGSLNAVVFTYDVYSFVPGRGARVELLRRMRAWLRPPGVIFLSARLSQGAYTRGILMLSRVAGRTSQEAAVGATHTRWIAADGTLQRAFVRSFSMRALTGEITEAGFVMGHARAGHVEIRPARPISDVHSVGTRPRRGTRRS
jgi:hypothetical protein